MKKELIKKKEENESLKRMNKVTKLNELSIENKTLSEELTKLKTFYDLSVQQNMQNEKDLKDYGLLKENFNKQQFIVLTLQDAIKRLQEEDQSRDEEYKKTKVQLNMRNEQIAKLKKDLNLQIQLKSKLSSKEPNEFNNIKGQLENKVTELKKESNFYRELADKRDRKIRDLEKLVKVNQTGKNINEQPNSTISSQFEENPEEKTDSNVLLLKSMLQEITSEKETLEKTNKELNEKLKSYEANQQFETSQKHFYEKKFSEKEDYSMLTEDSFNELIYVLIKNFEAKNLDVNIIESRVLSEISDFKDPVSSDTMTNNILTMLKV